MDFASMNVKALRAACKDARISYGSLDTAGMRTALEAHAAHAAHAAQEAKDLLIAQVGTLDADALAALGEFGLGTDGETAMCPHCGINHKDNGCTTPDDMGVNEEQDRTLHQLGSQHAEHACMGCGGEWGAVRPPYVAPTSKPTGATGTGLKIEKDRVARNGVKRPSVGGLCRAVWDWCDAQVAAGVQPTSKGVKAHALVAGWNGNNATIELYQWRKWSKPTADELAALAAAPAPAEGGAAPQGEGDTTAPQGQEDVAVQQDAASAA